MNSLPSHLLRRLGFVAILGAASLLFASRPVAANDPARDRLAATGVVPVHAVGPYVEVGTLMIQVSTKLGRPTTILPGGIWLYDNRTIDQGNAQGTLVVKFNTGRVCDLALVSPAIAVALRQNPSRAIGTYLVATK